MWVLNYFFVLGLIFEIFLFNKFAFKDVKLLFVFVFEIENYMINDKMSNILYNISNF